MDWRFFMKTTRISKITKLSLVLITVQADWLGAKSTRRKMGTFYISGNVC